MKIIFAIICSATLIACGTSKSKVINTAVHTKEKVVERLIPVEIAADSALLSALIECDSARNVIIKQLNEGKSKRLTSDLLITPVTKHSTELRYAIKTVRDTVYVTAKDSLVYQEIPLYIDVPVEVNRLSGWQHFQIWAGRIALLLIAIGLLLKIGKLT